MKELRLQDLNNNPFHGREIPKTAACFICGKDYPRDALAQHEKDCLASIQENDTQYTRGTEQDSTFSTRSARSNNSTSSTGSDKAGEKKHDRCYICGADVPTYLKSTHERNCKRSWELGLLNNATGSLKRQSSRGGLSRLGSGSDLRDTSGASLRKAKSSSNIGSELHERGRGFPSDGKRTPSASQKPSPAVSTSHKSLSRTASAISPPQKELSPNSGSQRNLTRLASSSITRPSTAPSGKATSKYVKSQSVSNLSQASVSNASDGLVQVNAELSQSSQDVGSAKSSSTPQYILCPCCGKLYSVHSIGIHQPQCERTRYLQKTVGLDPDTKRKSKSVSDMKSLASRLKSSLSRNLATNEALVSATSASRGSSGPVPNQEGDQLSSLSGRTNQEAESAFASRSMSGNRTVLDLEVSANIRGSGSSPSSPSEPVSSVWLPNGEDAVFRESEGRQATPGVSTTESPGSGGFQKCYLCHQVYGSRSLPIHEKQCLKKWERLSKEEKEKDKEKRKELREIQLIPFGRSKETSKTFGVSSAQHETVAASLPSPISDRSLSPLHSSLLSNPTVHQKSESSESARPPYKRNLLQSLSNDSADDGFTAYANEQTANPRFVTCVYCGRQYGPHSVAIHEKTCRLKHPDGDADASEKLDSVLEEESLSHSAKSKGRSKKIVDARPSRSPSKTKTLDQKDVAQSSAMPYTFTAIANGESAQLVACSDCKRRFLPNDIERHKLHCRITS